MDGHRDPTTFHGFAGKPFGSTTSSSPFIKSSLDTHLQALCPGNLFFLLQLNPLEKAFDFL